jgi:hypothetical protein
VALDAIMKSASFLCWMFFVLGCGNLIACALMHYSFGICGQWLGFRVRMQLFSNMLHQVSGGGSVWNNVGQEEGWMVAVCMCGSGCGFRVRRGLVPQHAA